MLRSACPMMLACPEKRGSSAAFVVTTDSPVSSTLETIVRLYLNLSLLRVCWSKFRATRTSTWPSSSGSMRKPRSAPVSWIMASITWSSTTCKSSDVPSKRLTLYSASSRPCFFNWRCSSSNRSSRSVSLSSCLLRKVSSTLPACTCVRSSERLWRILVISWSETFRLVLSLSLMRASSGCDNSRSRRSVDSVRISDAVPDIFLAHAW